jgi:ankyrin repeat protein
MQIPQLYAACREDDDKALQALITAGADVNVVDTEGRSPLHCACHWGKSSVVASLISSRANLYAKSSQGHTPMHFAVESGSSQCVRMLLEAGVSAKEAAGETRSTPLHWACSKRALQVCELLIKYGADVNAADINGNQPLHEGGMGSAEARLLIKHKADVNARDRNQRCPLHKFAYVGTRSVCVTLLEANAQPDAKDAEGN